MEMSPYSNLLKTTETSGSFLIAMYIYFPRTVH